MPDYYYSINSALWLGKANISAILSTTYSVKVTYQYTIKKTLSSGQHHIIQWKVSFNLDKQCTLLHICLPNLGKSFPFFWNSTADIERTAKLKPVKFRMVTSKYHAASADLSTFFVWLCMYLISEFLNFYWVFMSLPLDILTTKYIKLITKKTIVFFYLLKRFWSN